MLWRQVKTKDFKKPDITKDRWLKLKYEEIEPSAERGFAGFGCCFGGVWFRAYVDSCDQQYNTLIRIQPRIANVHFSNLDYKEFIQLINDIETNDTQRVIYLDPPYENTDCTPFSHSEFKYEEFLETLDQLLEDERNIIFMTEYKQLDQSLYRKRWEFNVPCKLKNTSDVQVKKEYLYLL